MNRAGYLLQLFCLSMVLITSSLSAGLRNKDLENESPMPRSYSSSEESTESSSEAELTPEEVEKLASKEAEKSKPASGGTKRRAEAFIAGADWEFDGFVAGGQDGEVKSMFATNDLVYLNIGSEQGLKPGERLGFYRRGKRVRDPQSGRMLGFEVRKLGVGEVTDLIDLDTCSLRVIYAYEAVEIGDLVRKE